MPTISRVWRVFVASPSDVQAERDAMDRVEEQLNRVFEQFGVAIRLIKWEKSTYPELDGSDAQNVINRQIGDDYDIFLGILWARFGTPTKRAQSGTEEEFERALARRRENPDSIHIMMYFKTGKIDPLQHDQAQLAKVREFRGRVKDLGLLWEFGSTDEFERRVADHLVSYITTRVPLANPLAASIRGILENADNRQAASLSIASPFPQEKIIEEPQSGNQPVTARKKPDQENTSSSDKGSLLDAVSYIIFGIPKSEGDSLVLETARFFDGELVDLASLRATPITGVREFTFRNVEEFAEGFRLLAQVLDSAKTAEGFSEKAFFDAMTQLLLPRVTEQVLRKASQGAHESAQQAADRYIMLGVKDESASYFQIILMAVRMDESVTLDTNSTAVLFRSLNGGQAWQRCLEAISRTDGSRDKVMKAITEHALGYAAGKVTGNMAQNVSTT